MIQFARYLFSEPVPLYCWSPVRAAGIYAIQVVDVGWRPRIYRPICFGRTEDFSERGTVSSHPAYREWAGEAGSEYLLWVSVHYEINGWQRLAKETALIQRYAPACNVAGDPAADLCLLHAEGDRQASPGQTWA